MSPPDTSALKRVPDASSTINLSGLLLAFDNATGALVGLRPAHSETEWASPGHPLGLLVYQTLNDTDWKPFTYDYINGHGMSGGFCKPGQCLRCFS